MYGLCVPGRSLVPCFFFFNDTATTEIYTLSLHDALPIYREAPWSTSKKVKELPHPSHTALARWSSGSARKRDTHLIVPYTPAQGRREEQQTPRSEEHTSELQSLTNLVCRLLLEKKKKKPK